MKKLLLSLLLFCAFANAQPIVNIPDVDFKNYLLNQPWINTNGDTEIQVSEAEVPMVLLPINLNIQSLQGIEAFTNLETLHCNQNPQLTTVDLSANLRLKIVDVSQSNIESLDLSGLSLVETVDVDDNIRMHSINLTGCDALRSFQAMGSPITNLDLSNKTALIHFTVGMGLFNNNLNTIVGSLNLSGCTALGALYLQENQLTSINLAGCSALTDFASYNTTAMQSINLAGCRNITNFRLNESVMTNIDLSDCTALQYFEMYKNMFTTLDFSNNPNLRSVQLILSSSNLRYVNLKNGSNESMIDFYSPVLEFICADESQLTAVRQEFWQESNLLISSYCSFFPGGDYNTITGKTRFDENNNGCDDTDSSQEFIKIKINDGTNQAATFTDAGGNYDFYTNDGSFTLTPEFENPSYFTISPATATINFPENNNSVTTQNFCMTANGVHPDVEVVFAPLNVARPGFDSNYKIVFKNKGNTTVSGNIVLNFDDNVLDLLSSSPAASSVLTGILTYNYSNLRPFESREIALEFNLNSPMEVPAVNIGYELVFFATINPVSGDETPEDNAFSFAQTVVGSYDPNDKLCLEGNSVSHTQIGKYLHYVINFENTGTYPAENVVIKDVINPSMFDVNSLQLLNASDAVKFRITGNVAEFIFEGIHLPIGAHGNVIFKIKTRSDLQIGSEVENAADIFFDYNFPIVTDPARTRFETLSTTGFSTELVKVYPNPASNFVQIQSEKPLKSIELYDIQGRLLLVKETINKNETINLSEQTSGIYLLKVISENGSILKKIMKE